MQVSVTLKFRPEVFDRIGAAESVRVNGWLLDEDFRTRLLYLKRLGWSFRQIALLTGHDWSAVAAWGRGEYLPRDAQTRMLIYQCYVRVRELETQELTAAVN